MTNPVTALKDLFAPPQTQFIGDVVAVAAGVIRVRVATGIIECQSAAGGSFVTGDSVLVRDRLVLSKVLPQDAVPTYRI